MEQKLYLYIINVLQVFRKLYYICWKILKLLIINNYKSCWHTCHNVICNTFVILLKHYLSKIDL